MSSTHVSTCACTDVANIDVICMLSPEDVKTFVLNSSIFFHNKHKLKCA